MFKGGFIYFASWNNKRKLLAIDREISRITKMRDSDRELYIFLCRSGFGIAALVSVSIMFSAVLVSEEGQKFYLAMQFINGGLAYLLSIYTLGYLRRVSNSKKTIANLQVKREKLTTSA
jgi:hypothetical protein